MREKRPYLEFFWSLFSRIQTEIPATAFPHSKPMGGKPEPLT